MLIETGRIGASGWTRPPFHPELRRAALLLPHFSLGPTSVRLLTTLRKRRAVPRPPVLADVAVIDKHIEGPDGDSIRVRLYRPRGFPGTRPAMLWMHGGGFVIGHPEFDQTRNIELCRTLGIVVAAVNYRFGPDHPFPAPIEDCHAALAWLHAEAQTLNIDPARIAVGGASAGAGLAAGLTLLAHDRDELPIAFQLLVYPMLDDRTTLRDDIDERSLRLWSARSNYIGWHTYLGHEPGIEGISDYAAPARRKDLTGLPPAWIGVGNCDLFLDEDIAYAARLNAAGAACALDIVDGAFHGFDLIAPNAKVSTSFRRTYIEAVRTHLRA